jgi:hypothetical protein
MANNGLQLPPNIGSRMVSFAILIAVFILFFWPELEPFFSAL